MLHATSCCRALEAVKIANRSSTLPLNVLTMRTSTSASSSGSSASSSSSSAAAASSSALSSYSFSATDTSSLMPPNTRASFSVDLRSIHFTPSISCAEHFFFGNSEKNTFCCLCAEDIEPPFTQRMHISASSRASHTNHTCREVVLDHITLLGMRGYPLDHLYEVWSDVLYSYPIFPRVQALTSPLWSWETRAAALMPYLKWLREVGVLDLCLAAVSPLLGGGGGTSGSSSSSSSANIHTEGGMSSSGSPNSSSSSSSSPTTSSGSGSMSHVNSDAYHIRRRVAFERVEYIGDCAWGNNVANRLMLLYPNEQWLYGERVYNFNCMRDAAEMNITLELLFDSLRLAELLPSRCIDHVGSGKIKADVVEAVLGELHITVWGLQPEIEDDAPYVEINGENEASLLMVAQHCLTEMYDLLVLGYVRELSGNALPIAKSLAARNIWFETQPFLRHHKSGRQRHWSRHRGGVGGLGMSLVTPPPRTTLTVPSASHSCMPMAEAAVPGSAASLTATASGSIRDTPTEEGEAKPRPESTHPLSLASEWMAPALSNPSSSSPITAADAEDDMSVPPLASASTSTEEGHHTPLPSVPEAPEGQGGTGESGLPPPPSSASPPPVEAAPARLSSALPHTFFPSLSLVPASAVGFSRGIEGNTRGSSSGNSPPVPPTSMVAPTMTAAWGGARFILPALPRLHPRRTTYPLSLPHPLLNAPNVPLIGTPYESDAAVPLVSSSSTSSRLGDGKSDASSLPPRHRREEASVDGGDGRSPAAASTARFGRPLAMPGMTSATSSSSSSASPSFAARLQLTRWSYTGTDVFACFHKSFLRLGLIQEDTRRLFQTVSAGVVRAAAQGYQRALVPSVALHWHHDPTESRWEESEMATSIDNGRPSRRLPENLSVDGEGGENLLSDALRRGLVDDAAHRGEVFFRDPYYQLAISPHPPKRGIRKKEEQGQKGVERPEEQPKTEAAKGEEKKGEARAVENKALGETKEENADDAEEEELVILQGSALLTCSCPWFLRIPSFPQGGTFPGLQIATLYAFPLLKEDALEDGDEAGEEGGEGNSAEDLKAVVIRCCWRRSSWTPPMMKPPTPGAITAQHPLHSGAFAYLGVGKSKPLSVSCSRVEEKAEYPSSSSLMKDKKETDTSQDGMPVSDHDTTTEAIAESPQPAKKEKEEEEASSQTIPPDTPPTTSSVSLPEAKEGATADHPCAIPAPVGEKDGTIASTLDTTPTESAIEEKKKEEAQEQEQQQRANEYAFWLQKHKEKTQRENPYFAARLGFSHFSSSSAGGAKNKAMGDTASPSGTGGPLKRPSRLTSVGGAASNIPIFQCSTPLSFRSEK